MLWQNYERKQVGMVPKSPQRHASPIGVGTEAGVCITEGQQRWCWFGGSDTEIKILVTVGGDPVDSPKALAKGGEPLDEQIEVEVPYSLDVKDPVAGGFFSRQKQRDVLIGGSFRRLQGGRRHPTRPVSQPCSELPDKLVDRIDMRSAW